MNDIIQQLIDTLPKDEEMTLTNGCDLWDFREVDGVIIFEMRIAIDDGKGNRRVHHVMANNRIHPPKNGDDEGRVDEWLERGGKL